MSTDDQGRKPAIRMPGSFLGNDRQDDSAAARAGTLPARPGGPVGPLQPRSRMDTPALAERAEGIGDSTLIGVKRPVGLASSHTSLGIHVLDEDLEPQMSSIDTDMAGAENTHAGFARSQQAASHWLDDMSSFLRSDTPAPAKSPFSSRTESQISRSQPVVAPGTIRGVAPQLTDELPDTPRPATSPQAPTVMRAVAAAPRTTVTDGRQAAAITRPHEAAALQSTPAPRPSSLGARSPVDPSPRGLVSQGPTSQPQSRQVPIAPRQTPVSTRPLLPINDVPHARNDVEDTAAGVMRRVKRKARPDTQTSSTATPTHAYSTSAHSEERKLWEAPARPVSQESTPAPARPVPPFSRSLFEEGDMGDAADDLAARPLGDQEQVTRSAGPPDEYFAKALRFDDTLLDRPSSAAAPVKAAPAGTARGVDWRLSMDDGDANDDTMGPMHEGHGPRSPLSSLPTAPMTRPNPSVSVPPYDFADTQRDMFADNAEPVATVRLGKPTGKYASQDTLPTVARPVSPPPAAVRRRAISEDLVTPGIHPMTPREYGALDTQPSQAVDGPVPRNTRPAPAAQPDDPFAMLTHGFDEDPLESVRKASSDGHPSVSNTTRPEAMRPEPAPLTSKPSVAPASGLLGRLRSMGTQPMTRDTIVALVIGVTVLFVALIFVFWALSQ